MLDLQRSACSFCISSQAAPCQSSSCAAARILARHAGHIVLGCHFCLLGIRVIAVLSLKATALPAWSASLLSGAAAADGRRCALQTEAQLEETRAGMLALQAVRSRRKSSLVCRLIRGGLSILAAALTLQQVCIPALLQPVQI